MTTRASRSALFSPHGTAHQRPAERLARYSTIDPSPQLGERSLSVTPSAARVVALDPVPGWLHRYNRHRPPRRDKISDTHQA